MTSRSIRAQFDSFGHSFDRSTDESTLNMLRRVGIERVPSLRFATEVTGRQLSIPLRHLVNGLVIQVCTYSGLRPATQHRDYQVISAPAFDHTIMYNWFATD